MFNYHYVNLCLPIPLFWKFFFFHKLILVNSYLGEELLLLVEIQMKSLNYLLDNKILDFAFYIIKLVVNYVYIYIYIYIFFSNLLWC